MKLNFEEEINPIMRIPPETNENISKAIENNLRPYREQLGSQNVRLQTDVLKLKESLGHANEQRLRTNKEIENIRDELNAQRTLEDVKRRELQKVMFGRRNAKNKGRVRVNIPPPPEGKTIFNFPKLPKPFNHRSKEIMTNVKEDEKPFKTPLFTKSVNVPKRSAPEYEYNHFSEEKISKALIDEDRKANPEFFSKMNMGISLGNDFPNLPEDFQNNQGIVEPRFRNDHIDDLGINFRELNQRNQTRLKALDEDYEYIPQEFINRKNAEKIDKIVDALNNYTKGESFYQDQDENDQNGKQKQRESFFRKSGFNLIKEAGRNGPKHFYKRKNHVPPDKYFKRPEKFEDWDKKFNFQEYL